MDFRVCLVLIIALFATGCGDSKPKPTNESDALYYYLECTRLNNEDFASLDECQDEYDAWKEYKNQP